jgi:hypothetical protein
VAGMVRDNAEERKDAEREGEGEGCEGRTLGTVRSDERDVVREGRGAMPWDLRCVRQNASTTAAVCAEDNKDGVKRIRTV